MKHIQQSLIPVQDGMFGYNGTLPDQLWRMIHKLIKIMHILGLTSNRSQSFMPDNILLFLILNTLPDQVLITFTTNLPEHKTHLMFQQACLRFEVFLAQ